MADTKINADLNFTFADRSSALQYLSNGLFRTSSKPCGLKLAMTKYRTRRTK